MTSKPFFFDATNTYCISLQSHKDRWTNMSRRFTKMNLEVTRFEACTTLDTSMNFADYLNIGQKLCAQSHVKLWNHILTTDSEYALILEDDACFAKQWKIHLEELDIEKRKGFDAIFLNASEPENQLFSWVKAEEQYLTGAYIISIKGLQHITELFMNQYHSSDWMTSRLQKMSNCYTFFPWLVIQSGEDSTIGSNSNEDHKKVIRCLKEFGCSLDNYIF